MESKETQMGFSVACFLTIHASRQDIIASDEEYEPNALPQTAEEWLQDIAQHPDVIRYLSQAH